MRPRILFCLFFLFFLADLGWTQESAEEWFKKGNEATEARDYEKAIRCFDRTVALEPNHLGGYRNMGCVFGMRSMWDEAIEPFKKALAMNPDDAQIHHNLGFCWYKKGMLDEAVAEFEKAIALDLEFRDAYHNLGIVYGKKKMFDKAIPMFKEAVKIRPDNADTHLSLGKAYKEVGDDMLAADHYYKAGILYLQKGHREGALAAYENVVPYSKEIADVLFRRLYPDEEASDVTRPVLSKKEESWHILLRRMNIRQDPSTSGKITRKLNKNAEFQVIEEAPDNNPRNSWYLIRTRSGFSGWLCGIYNGNVKYKDLPQPDLLQKDIAGDLVKRPHSDEEASDLREPLVSDQEQEVSEVTEPLPSEKQESWHVLLRRMNIRQDPSISGKITRKLNKNAEFQIIEEAPDNNPHNSWYLIRTRSGFSGWLCGIYNGNVKYKDLPQSDFLAPR